MQTTIDDWDVNEIGNRAMRDMRFVMGDSFGEVEMAMVDGFIYGQEDQGLMDFFEAYKYAVYSECRRRLDLHNAAGNSTCHICARDIYDSLDRRVCNECDGAK